MSQTSCLFILFCFLVCLFHIQPANQPFVCMYSASIFSNESVNELVVMCWHIYSGNTNMAVYTLYQPFCLLFSRQSLGNSHFPKTLSIRSPPRYDSYLQSYSWTCQLKQNSQSNDSDQYEGYLRLFLIQHSAITIPISKNSTF